MVVEDVQPIAAPVVAALGGGGMVVLVARIGAEAVARKPGFRADVVLVDLDLPDVDGLELVRRFASDGDCGAIVVTANGAEVARVAGPETGADDYVLKPVRRASWRPAFARSTAAPTTASSEALQSFIKSPDRWGDWGLSPVIR